MDIDTCELSAPSAISGHTVKYRLSAAQQMRISETQDGRATKTIAHYDGRFMRVGLGTVSTEGIYTDQALLQGYAHQPGMTGGRRQMPGSPSPAASRRTVRSSSPR